MTLTALTVPHPVTGEALPAFLTAREAAQLLGMDEGVLRDALAIGQFPSLPHEVGAPWRIPTVELLRAAGFSSPVPTVRGASADGGVVTESDGGEPSGRADRDERGRR